MKIYLLIFTVCLSLSLNLISGTGQGDIAMFRGNAQLTGVYDVSPVYKLDGVKFTFKTEGPVRSTPAISNGIIYFGSGDGNFYAIDGLSGKQVWSFKTGGEIHSSPAVTNGIVYFTSRDGYLYALHANDGSEAWKYKMGADLGNFNYWDYYLSSPSIEDQVLYIGSGDGNLYAFDLASHKVIWQFNAGSRIRSTPSVTNNLVVFGATDGCVYAINKTDGTQQWKFATDGASLTFESGSNDRTSVMCSPAVSDNLVAIGGRDGFVYGLDLNTGELKWKVNHKGSWVLSTAIDEGKVYVGAGSGYFVQALDVNTGTELWKFKTQSAVFSSLCIAKDMIYFNDFAGNVYAIDKSGTEKWKFPMGTRSSSTPVLSNGVVYSGADDGILYALQGSNSNYGSTVNSRKVVYWEEGKSKDSFHWFINNTDVWIRDYFKSSGYELMDSKMLEKFMKEQLSIKSTSVIVFADNIIPRNVFKERNENSLIRQYLNANGKIALLGNNPTVFLADSLGVVDSVDYDLPGIIFGVPQPDNHEVNGYYSSKVTEEGQKWGLRNFWTGSGAVNPADVTTVLAYDEFGKASSWVKNYGGPEGTGLLQLMISRTAAGPDLYPLRAAIEYGIDW